MIGRRVHHRYSGIRGVVVAWEPLGAGMTDTMVRGDDGRECWVDGDGLSPDDGMGGLPSRAAIRKSAAIETHQSLIAIRDRWTKEREPWPGAEFGKVIVGRALEAAIAKAEREIEDGEEK